MAERAAGCQLSPGAGEMVLGQRVSLSLETCRCHSLSPFRIPAPHPPPYTHPNSGPVLRPELFKEPAGCTRVLILYHPGAVCKNKPCLVSGGPSCTQLGTASIQSWKGPQLSAYTQGRDPHALPSPKGTLSPLGRVTRAKTHHTPAAWKGIHGGRGENWDREWRGPRMDPQHRLASSSPVAIKYFPGPSSPQSCFPQPWGLLEHVHTLSNT